MDLLSSFYMRITNFLAQFVEKAVFFSSEYFDTFTVNETAIAVSAYSGILYSVLFYSIPFHSILFCSILL